MFDEPWRPLQGFKNTYMTVIDKIFNSYFA